MGSLNSHFAIGLDGTGQILCLLTALAFPIIFISTWKEEYKKANNFFGLMLLSQAGLLGVFLATDALLFYFFWELALIPVYFLASQWGGEKRIAATFKFFIYTFLGSLMMLIGIIYIYFHTRDHSFALECILRGTFADTGRNTGMVVLVHLYGLRRQDAHLSFSYLAARYL